MITAEQLIRDLRRAGVLAARDPRHVGRAQRRLRLRRLVAAIIARRGGDRP